MDMWAPIKGPFLFRDGILSSRVFMLSRLFAGTKQMCRTPEVAGSLWILTAMVPDWRIDGKLV